MRHSTLMSFTYLWRTHPCVPPGAVCGAGPCPPAASQAASAVRRDSSQRLIRLFTLPAVSLALAALLAPGLLSADSGLDTLIHGIEQRYNRARTLSVDFTETYTVAGRSHRPESGNLVLRKPGRMRWTYTEPAGKLFVSDGHNAYLYTAANNRVERSTLKASEDLHAPMAFLLGKLDLKKEFRAFETKPAGPGTYIVAEARTDRLPYEKVQMLVGSDYAIQQLTVHGRDGSVLGFTFKNEVVNPAVPDQAFRFTAPPGADIIDAVNTGSGEN
jgi:outer membrane lipoprotein carrier protein